MRRKGGARRRRTADGSHGPVAQWHIVRRQRPRAEFAAGWQRTEISWAIAADADEAVFARRRLPRAEPGDAKSGGGRAGRGNRRPAKRLRTARRARFRRRGQRALRQPATLVSKARGNESANGSSAAGEARQTPPVVAHAPRTAALPRASRPSPQPSPQGPQRPTPASTKAVASRRPSSPDLRSRRRFSRSRPRRLPCRWRRRRRPIG